MRVVIDNIEREHFKLLAEMGKALHFNVKEIELTEDEEDAYLLAAMKATENEIPVSDEEANEFEAWLRSSIEEQK